MRSLDESLRDRVLATLRLRQRRAALEEFLLGLMFLAAGIFLTLGAFWMTILAVAYVLAPFGGKRLHPGLFVGIGAVIFAALIIWRRKRIVEESMSYELPSTRDSLMGDTIGIAMDAAVAFLFICPRCIVLFWQFTASAWRILKADVSELASPIEIALVRRRKICARDLPGIDMEEFLAKVEWVPGIARLYREPIGFVLTLEFRRKILGARPEPPPSPEEPLPPNFDDLNEELRWALLTMGLSPKPTRKEINNAYRDLAKQVHPDLQSDPTSRQESEERMKDLNLAYEILRQKT